MTADTSPGERAQRRPPLVGPRSSAGGGDWTISRRTSATATKTGSDTCS